ncbi:MAG: tetratricopeptide repeat protein, partial [Planctomycetota bacterium]
REKIARVAIAMGRFNDAKDQVTDHLLKSDPGNADFHALHAACFNGLGEPQKAIEAMGEAVKAKPDAIGYATALAQLHTREGNWQQARAELDQLVQRNSQNIDAYLARGRWLLTNPTLSDPAKPSNLNAAWADATFAINLDATKVPSVLFGVSVALQIGKAAELKALIEKTLKANPSTALLYQASAEIDFALNERDQAIKTLERGKTESSQPELLLPTLTRVYLENGQFEDAKSSLEALRKTDYPEPGVRLLGSSILASEGKFSDAIALIEKSLDAFRPFPELDRNAQFLLARCYAESGFDDKQLLAIERASELDPNWIPARVELALLYTRLGRVADAIREYEKVARSPDAPARAIAGYAELLMQQTSTQSVGRRLDQLIERLGNIESAALETGLLRAQMFYSGGDIDAARTQLASTADQYPESFAVWRASIMLEANQNAWDRAIETLGKARTNLGDTAPLRVMEAQLLISEKGDEVSEDVFIKLAEPSESWSANQKGVLLQSFAEIFFRLEQFENSRRCVDAFLGLPENDENVRLLLLLFDLEFRSDNRARLGQIVKKLKAAEGRDGTLWKIGEAMRLTLSAEESDDPRLTKALALLTEAELSRPDLGRIQRLKGQVQLKLGQQGNALESLLSAVERGDQDVEFVSSVVRQLIENQRFVKADQLIRELQATNASLSSDIVRAASQVSVRLSDFERARTIAEELAAQSDDENDRIWLAQIQAISGDVSTAISTLEKVIEDHPDSAAARISLVQLLAASGEKAAARKVMDEAAEALSSEESSYQVGQGYEVLGDLRLASEFYENAAEAAEGDQQVSIARRLASVRSKMGDVNGAQVVLSALLENADVSETERQSIRRQLALLIAKSEKRGSLADAIELLTENEINGEQSIEDRRARAVLLATYGTEPEQKEAIEIVNGLVQDGNRSIDDHLLLARLYGQSDDWKSFDSIVRRLMSIGGAERADCVRMYALALIEQEKFDDSLAWIDRLRSLQSDEIDVDGLQVRVLLNAKRFDELEQFLKSRSDRRDRLFWAANTAEAAADSLSNSPAEEAQFRQFLLLADSLYRKLSTVDGHPNHLLAFFARQGRTKELLKLKVSPEDLAKLAQTAIVANRIDADQMKEMISRLEMVEQSPGIRLVIADAYAWLGDWENALSNYEDVLKEDSDNPSANNNMAFVLALTDSSGTERASKAIEAAAEKLPFSPVVRDTRGLVLMKQGKLEEAENEFRQALSGQPDPGTLLHLAIVQWRQGAVEEAKESFERLQGSISTERIFHPLDLRLYQELIEKLKSPGESS